MEQVSAETGIDVAVLTAYENETEEIRRNDIQKLTEHYQVNADYLLALEHGFLYAEIESLSMVINFSHEEYAALDKAMIYYVNGKRHFDYNDIAVLFKYQDYVTYRWAQIRSVDWKCIKDINAPIVPPEEKKRF